MGSKQDPEAGDSGQEGAGARRPLGFMLQRAHGLLRQRLTEVLAGTGLHLGHIAILGTLAETPGLSQRALSSRTGIEKSSMVIFIDGLEREGWIHRARDPQDRRAHALGLTEAGAGRLATIGPMLQRAEREYLAVLTEAEQAQLGDMLARLIAGAD